MQGWLAPSLISLFSFGLWGFFTKLSTEFIDFKSALVYQSVGVLIVSIIGFYLVDFKPATESKGVLYAVLTGLSYAIGCLFYFVAASKGRLMTVVTLTALYPVITILLSYLLFQETFTVKKTIGILLALVAIILMLE